MITIRNRKMIVPANERHLCVEGDNNTCVREFSISREEKDLTGLSFFVDLLYEDGQKNENIILDPITRDEDMLLTWNVISNDVPNAGTVLIQLKAIDLSGMVKWKSYMEPFYIEGSIATGEDYTGSLSAYEVLAARMEQIASAENERIEAEIRREQDYQDVTEATNNANTAADRANTSADNADYAISDIETRFNTLTTEQQQDAEVIDARKGKASLRAKVDDIDSQLAETMQVGYSNTNWFNPIVVAREKGKHLAFGSICRVAELSGGNTLDVNLVVYRSGINHSYEGIIRGVLVSNLGTPLGEPFTIADPINYPAPARNGNIPMGDYRDPNAFLLPDGRILITFVAERHVEGDRVDSESYVILGTWSPTNLNIQWSTPVLQFSTHGKFLYGKPFVKGNYIYSAVWTDGKLTDSNGNTKGYVARAPLSSPDVFEITGSEIYTVPHALYSEPVLRPKPSGGYFIQVRYENAGTRQIHRFDSDDLVIWSDPTVIFEGSAHSKGLEILDDGRYFTGIRYINSRPGVAILTTEKAADTPIPLILSAVVYSSQSTSGEAGYMEFQKIKENEYLGMFHTEGGKSIRCFNFTLSQIMDKRVKTSESIYPIMKIVSADQLDPLIHVNRKASRSHNLITNPILHTPYGFSRPFGWQGTTVAISDGTETDSPGEGYPKVTISAGVIITNVKMPYSRLFANQPLIGAARIYCKTPNRVRIRGTFGVQKTSAYHSGRGWETLLFVSKNAQYQSLDGTGAASNPITFEITSTGTGSYNFYVDWVSLGFGETVPEVLNDSLERITSLARVELNAKTNNFTLANLGFRSPANVLTYSVTILDSTFEILGYSVAKTATDFTITLTDGTTWGSGKMAILEVMGV